MGTEEDPPGEGSGGFTQSLLFPGSGPPSLAFGKLGGRQGSREACCGKGEASGEPCGSRGPGKAGGSRLEARRPMCLVREHVQCSPVGPTLKTVAKIREALSY